jgi:hypothetical protein
MDPSILADTVAGGTEHAAIPVARRRRTLRNARRPDAPIVERVFPTGGPECSACASAIVEESG